MPYIIPIPKLVNSGHRVSDLHVADGELLIRDPQPESTTEESLDHISYPQCCGVKKIFEPIDVYIGHEATGSIFHEHTTNHLARRSFQISYTYA
jgi:hypothetical protein